MGNFWPYMGGIIGGYTLVKAPVEMYVASVEPVVNFVGALSMVVFAGFLVYEGVRTMLGK